MSPRAEHRAYMDRPEANGHPALYRAPFNAATRLQSSHELRASWSWTNWTVGVWWDRRKLHAAGLDLGPLELIVRRRRVMRRG